jgi:hypothetical protein
VDENGKPLAGVKITLFGHEQRERARGNVRVIAEKITGADGEFRFERVVDVAREFPTGLPDDRFPQPPIKILTVVARAAGRATSTEGGLASWAARRGMAPHFVMQPAATLRGRITGPDGQPVADAEVIAGFGGGADGTVNTARTDAEGRYSIDDLSAYDGARVHTEHQRLRERQLEAAKSGEKPPANTLSLWAGPMMMLVKHPDFAAKRVAVDNIPGEQDVQLAPAASIEGRVLINRGDGALSPAANVNVILVRDRPRRDADIASQMFAFQTEQTAADAEGRYRFGSLPAGEYHLMARAGGSSSPALKGVAVNAGQAASAPDMVMTPGGVVRFTLIDEATGQPLELTEGAKIYVSPYARPELPPGLSPVASNVVTLSAGAKGEMRLPPGEYVLLASVPGDANKPHWQSANFANFQNTSGVRIAEGKVAETTILMTKILPAQGPTATLTLSGPPMDEDVDREAPARTGAFVPATAPADGPEAAATPSSDAKQSKPEKFVRLVVGQEGAMTFEGAKTTWEALPALLEKVADREKTVLEIAIASDDMTVREANNVQGAGFRLASQFRFLSGSFVGLHPLGSKGGEQPPR